MKKRLFILSTGLLLANAAVGGVTNYVSLSGSHISPFSSWPTAATNIQAAVNAEGDTVVVSNGTYRLDTVLSIPAGHTVLSLNGAGETVIDGKDAVRCVQINDSELQGFTVTHGYALGGSAISPDQKHGAGIHAEGSSITSCIIQNNFSSGKMGAGLYATGCTVSNCVFQDNQTAYSISRGSHGERIRTPGRGAGIYCSDTLVEDCLFRRNFSQYGGGIYAVGFSEIKRCRIEKNQAKYGGGVYTETGALVEQSRIANNRAEFGGGIYINRGGTIRNCFIHANRAASVPELSTGEIIFSPTPIFFGLTTAETTNTTGGAVYMLGAGTIESCTLTGNNSDYGGVGSIQLESSLDLPADSVIQNCIIWNNEGAAFPPENSEATLLHNCTEDPQLVDPESVLLAATSPCINSGTNQNWMTDAQDFFGNERILNCVDIGACETSSQTVDFLASPAVGLAPLTVQFNALFSATNVSERYVEWDFGNDGTIDAASWGAVSVSHIYQETETYSVALYADGICIQNHLIEVLPPVKADFTVDRQIAVAPAVISFDDRSQHEPQYWSWDLNGDGQVDSTNSSSSYWFEEPGIYTASLTVSNHFGAGGSSSDTQTYNITIIPPVEAHFSVSPVVVQPGETVHFIDESQNDPTAWNWSFGEDGATTNSQHTQYAFDTPGWKTVRLIVENKYSSSTYTQERAVRVLAPTPIHYVSAAGSHTPPFTSWLTASTNIQAAIDASETPDTILVASGIYTSQGVARNGTNVFVLDKDVEIWGEADTVIDGQGMMRGACLLNGMARNLIFKNGFAATIEGIKNSGKGGGVWLENAELINCVVSENRAELKGGGVWLKNAYLVNCLVSENHADLKGGGVYTFGGTIKSCTIADNSAVEEAGGLLSYSYWELPMSINPVLKNVGENSIQNSIIQQNEALANTNYSTDDIGSYPISAPSFSTCCLDPQPYEWMEESMLAPLPYGNITNSPAFRADGDYRLSPDSPCINTGANQTWMSGSTDLEQKPRILYGTVDIGAYEYFENLAITHFSENDARSTWTTRPGAVYQLQACDDLATAEWVNIGSPITATSTELSASDPVPANQRFYRIIRTD
ncbi:MAG: right-handed parallel beta-helix repeat-containing protein [Pontiellaceae bacterium]|nr:right-handed parallel beta-helix repeat-containing protein [Pontiellaceae bacterium]